MWVSEAPPCLRLTTCQQTCLVTFHQQFKPKTMTEGIQSSNMKTFIFLCTLTMQTLTLLIFKTRHQRHTSCSAVL